MSCGGTALVQGIEVQVYYRGTSVVQVYRIQ